MTNRKVRKPCLLKLIRTSDREPKPAAAALALALALALETMHLLSFAAPSAMGCNSSRNVESKKNKILDELLAFS